MTPRVLLFVLALAGVFTLGWLQLVPPTAFWWFAGGFALGFAVAWVVVNVGFAEAFARGMGW